MTVQVKNSMAWKKRSFQFSIYCILILQKKKVFALSVGRLTKTACQEIKFIWIEQILKQKIFKQHGNFLVAPSLEKSPRSPPQPPCGLRNMFGSCPLRQLLI